MFSKINPQSSQEGIFSFYFSMIFLQKVDKYVNDGLNEEEARLKAN
jgi:hypothetical protein